MRSPCTSVRWKRIDPWLIVDDADKLDLDLVWNLGSRYEVSVATTIPSPNERADRFEDQVARNVHLLEISDAIPATETPFAFIEADRIDRILLSTIRAESGRDRTENAVAR